MFGFVFLMVGVAFLVKSYLASKTGKTYVGWAFESVYAYRDENRYLFWFMLYGNLLFGLLAFGGGICDFVFPVR
jgi:hypothetical protein